MLSNTIFSQLKSKDHAERKMQRRIEPRGNELIKRYKENYLIPQEANITEAMILTHWELEKQLTGELLQSTVANRWDTFDRCYTRLYAELEWLNRLSDQNATRSQAEYFSAWAEAIGPPPLSVYEIGSGRGDLISYLANRGFACKGTEITHERGQKHVTAPLSGLSWGISDGVHLDNFELPETYDVVISNQVIEHLHPDDLGAHLKGVHRILKRGGRYLFCTPHRYTGPHDVSRVFKLDQPRGMHLKEYTYRELVEATKSAGFGLTYGALLSKKLRKLLRFVNAHCLTQSERLGTLYLRLQLSLEKILSVTPSRHARHVGATLLRKLLIFADNICLVAEKV